MKKIILAAIASMLAVPALAADMAVKAPPVVPAPTCSLTSCTGFFIGGIVDESGGNFNLVATGLGGIAQNQFATGLRAGWEYWDTKWYARAEIIGMYGIAQNGNLPGQGNSALWSVGALVKLGYNFLGQSTLPVAASFFPTWPRIDIALCHHRRLDAAMGIRLGSRRGRRRLHCEELDGQR